MANAARVAVRDLRFQFGFEKFIASIEAPGGAHRDPQAMIGITGEAIALALAELRHLDSDAIRKQRRQKFLDIGRKLSDAAAAIAAYPRLLQNPAAIRPRHGYLRSVDQC